MTQEKELTDHEHQELSSLYQVTVSDLSFFKSQQWTITNYALVAFAVITGIFFLEDIDVGCYVLVLLCLAATVVYVFSIVLLYRLKSSIEERRARLDRVFEGFSKKFNDARGDKEQVSASEINYFLVIVLTVGIVLVWWLAYANQLFT